MEPDGGKGRRGAFSGSSRRIEGGQRGTPVEYSTEARHWRHNSYNHGPACMLGAEIRMHIGTARGPGSEAICRAIMIAGLASVRSLPV